MFAAAHFARSALEIESNYTDLIDGKLHFAHRGYVTGAVFSAAASLEATINELFIDAQDPGSPTFEGADSRLPGLLAGTSWGQLEKKSTLYKYQKALSLAGKQEFNRDEPPYKAVDDLIELRNALVHYKPEWSTNQKKHQTISNRLEEYRFTPNPYAGPNDVFFPKKCLGHGCAAWTVKSGVTFIESLFSQLGLPSIFRNHPQELLQTR
jgi:hypothetical protein